MVVNYNGLQIELAERFGIKELRYLASGDDSDTFLGDDRYVIKVPRRESVIQMQRREFQLYSFLNRHEFSFQIPMVIYEGDYYNVMNYISGKRITYKDYTALSEKEQNALAIDEAAFLQELHNVCFDLEEVSSFTVQQNKKLQYEEDHEKVIHILTENRMLSERLRSKIDNWYKRILQIDYLYEYTPCITHNDFSAGNLIFRGNRLYGVIDFGDSVIGDPDNDFLYLLDSSKDDFGKEFGRKVLYYYGHNAPEIAEKKAEINDAYWTIQQILLGDERRDRRLMEKGIAELSNLDIRVLDDRCR